MSSVTLKMLFFTYPPKKRNCRYCDLLRRKAVAVGMIASNKIAEIIFLVFCTFLLIISKYVLRFAAGFQWGCNIR